MERRKVTIQDIVAKKQRGEKVVRVICYDYPFAVMADRAGVDAILVGDSVGMVLMGLSSTVPVTMDEMIHYCKNVVRGVKYALVIGDLPFGTYQTGVRDAIWNACRLVKEGGVDAVKLEGGKEFAPVVKAIVQAGIPVVGHIGLTPQTATMLGGFRVQGRDVSAALKLIEDAKALEEAGAFMLTLECIPDRLAKVICEELTIPGTGIGAGPYTDGQSLNIYDFVGLFERFTPKFVKKYANLSEQISQALQQYVDEVKAGAYPGPEHSYSIGDEEIKAILESRAER